MGIEFIRFNKDEPYWFKQLYMTGGILVLTVCLVGIISPPLAILALPLWLLWAAYCFRMATKKLK